MSAQARAELRAQARARKRRRARARVAKLLWAGVVLTSVLGLSALVKMSYADYRWARGAVEDKEAQLRALQTQHEAGQRRLAFLQKPKGQAQSLIEHGYVPPGDRILLFPASPPNVSASQIQGGEAKRFEGKAAPPAPTQNAKSAVEGAHSNIETNAVSTAPAGTPPPVTPPSAPPSAWRRAGRTVEGWWQAMRGASSPARQP